MNTRVPWAREGKVLDIGCGRQPFRKMLESFGFQYIGLDAREGPGVVADFVAVIDEPLPDSVRQEGPFSFVICTEVLEHVANWSQAFQNIAVLARPGTKVLITCPHFYQLHEEPYDFWRPTLHALHYFAERSGMRVVLERKAGDAWDVLGTVLVNCRIIPGTWGLAAWLLSVGARLCHSFCLFLLGCRILRRVAISSPLYLSNVVVLEKL